MIDDDDEEMISGYDRHGFTPEPFEDDDAPILTAPLPQPVRPKTVFHPIPISKQKPPPLKPPASMVARGAYIPPHGD